MKILLLTFYYEPDLSAGSFRNTALVKAMQKLLKEEDHIDIVTTLPNRYSSFEVDAPYYEKVSDKVDIFRIELPKHTGGFFDQIWSFKSFYTGVWSYLKRQETFDYDLVYASSSRLFTAFLGARVSNKYKIPLYLDIRDIFVDTIDEVVKNAVVKSILVPVLTFIEKYTITSAAKLNVVSGGFNEYFARYYSGEITEYTNGIDEIFLDQNFEKDPGSNSDRIIITYAGNIGDGQGLDKIVPDVAQRLGGKYEFRIIGDGGKRLQLEKALQKKKISNVRLIEPVSRQKLLAYYKDTDYLFLHLNDYNAFKKVLPSKIFEYSATRKPLIAGVSGFSRVFLKENVNNVILFDPCDTEELVEKLLSDKRVQTNRKQFINKYRRSSIMENMARSIVNTTK